MKEITCADNFTSQVEHSNITSSSEKVPGLQHNHFIFAVFVVSLSLAHSVKMFSFHMNICSPLYVSSMLLQICETSD